MYNLALSFTMMEDSTHAGVAGAWPSFSVSSIVCSIELLLSPAMSLLLFGILSAKARKRSCGSCGMISVTVSTDVEQDKRLFVDRG